MTRPTTFEEAIPAALKSSQQQYDFVNGGTDVVIPTDAGDKPSLSKFLNDKDADINSAADGILANSRAARDTTIAARDYVSEVFLGALTADPVVNPVNGAALVAGMRYFNIVSLQEKTYNGAMWYVPNVDGQALSLETGSSTVGFRQTAPKTKARAASSKLQERYDYTDFGALGLVDVNGLPLTDETVAVQAAWDAVRDYNIHLQAKGRQRFLTRAPIVGYPSEGQIDMGQAMIVPDMGATDGVANFVGNRAVTLIGMNSRPVGGNLRINVAGPYSLLRGRTSPDLSIVDLTLHPQIDGIVFQGGAVAGPQLSLINAYLFADGFRDGIAFTGSSIYAIHMHFPNVRSCWRRGWYFTRNQDFGENFMISGGATANCKNGLGTGIGFYEDGTTNLTMGIYNHSLDYCDVLSDVSSGRWTLVSPFPENSNNNPQFVVRQPPAVGPEPTEFHMVSTFANRGPLGSAETSGPTAAETTNGRECIVATYGDNLIVDIDHSQLGRYAVRDTELVKVMSGSPIRIRTKGWLRPGAAVNGGQTGMIPCRATSLLKNGDFENGLTGWTTSVFGDAGALSIDTTVAKRGTQSVKMKWTSVTTGGVTTNSSSGLSQVFGVTPGEMLYWRGWLKRLSVTNGYIDVIMDYAVENDSGVPTWSRLQESGIYAGSTDWLFQVYWTRVPEGCTKCRLTFRMYAPSGWAQGEFNLDDWGVWCL